MNETELKKILEDHVKWLKDPRTGERADLHDANLRGADLTNADLTDADLSGANLRGADLSYANLRCANLRGADLRGTYLYGADLSYANLRCAYLPGANLSCADLTNADLYRADLRRADLHRADLRRADLRRADLRGADLNRAYLYHADLSDADLYRADLSDVKTDENTKGFHLVCPAEGEFIGWKKARGLVVKLKVPAGARRSSATTNKCRCSKAEVLAIEELDGAPSRRTKKVPSDYDLNFIYEVGKTVEVNDFDEDRWNECSTGIHFFMTREEAVDW